MIRFDVVHSFIFDIGGVLLKQGPFDKYDKVFGSKEKAMEIWDITRPFRIMCDAGASHKSMVSALEFIYPDKFELIKKWYELWVDEELIPIPDNIQLLEDLSARGYGLYAITNWSSLIDEVMSKFEFFKLFRDIVISSKVQILKPNPDLFHILLDRNELKKEECVFIDDNLKNITAAENMGITSVHYQSETDLRVRIAKILNNFKNKGRVIF